MGEELIKPSCVGTYALGWLLEIARSRCALTGLTGPGVVVSVECCDCGVDLVDGVVGVW